MSDPSTELRTKSPKSDEDDDVICLATQRELREGEITWLAPAVIVGSLVLFVVLGIALVLFITPPG